MVDAVQADEADDNEIDGDDVINNRGAMRIKIPAARATIGEI